MNNHGFTLLELLVALGISSVLAAIAIPQYQQYRQRAFDARALSDLQNIALAEEAYFIDNEAYLSCSDDICLALPGIAAISSWVSVSISAAESSFTGNSSNSKGSGKIYQWDSAAGGLLN